MSYDPAHDPILAALRARGSGVRRIRYRENRSVLLSVSRDGATLNSHDCFRDAPPDIVQAIVAVLTEPRGAVRRRALRRLHDWDGTREGLTRARRRKEPRERGVNGRETAPLRALFRRLNREKFEGRLPEIPLRVSRRMTRTLGTVRFGGGAGEAGSVGDGAGGGRRRSAGAGASAGPRGSSVAGSPASRARTVTEIAIAADLLRPGNRGLLEDTMLHEMAHAEAWLRHGHRGHGRVWREVARRVGCRPRAVNDVRVAGRER